jgi:hypothetical protein
VPNLAYLSGLPHGLRTWRSAVLLGMISRVSALQEYDPDCEKSLRSISAKSADISRYFKGLFPIGNVEVRSMDGQPVIPAVPPAFQRHARMGTFSNIRLAFTRITGSAMKHYDRATDARFRLD